ncbi:hypothetical protein [Nocardia otitidiscaviarum]|uniref:hypothetical protein n=1 Tax=Nocardia otitidiscaviarum TaxID=1823 RepID=UPI0012FAD95B|nr:hypothetical protein [Nocardia otitidiscaviarum]
MEYVIALLLVAATLAAALSTSARITRNKQRRAELTVADIQARLDAEHARAFSQVRRW